MKNLKELKWPRELEREWERAYEKRMEIYRGTSAYKKMWNYFLDISKMDYYNKKIKELRSVYQIPKNGFQDAKYIFPPEQWLLRRTEYASKLDKEIKRLCEKYGLHFIDWGEVIEMHLFYDRIDQPLYSDLNSHNLFYITTTYEEDIDPFSPETVKADKEIYPIALRISPYTSKRDLLEFINKTYKTEIKPLQDKYRDKHIKIGKVRNKDPLKKERNEFIYQNRNLPRKKICKMVSEKFNEILDVGLIGKIISLEIRSRKEL